jgi:hypothetical protein
VRKGGESQRLKFRKLHTFIPNSWPKLGDWHCVHITKPKYCGKKHASIPVINLLDSVINISKN